MNYSEQTNLEQETLDLLVSILRCPSVTPDDAGSLEIIKNYLGEEMMLMLLTLVPELISVKIQSLN
jgi:hypothetical protein